MKVGRYVVVTAMAVLLGAGCSEDDGGDATTGAASGDTSVEDTGSVQEGDAPEAEGDDGTVDDGGGSQEDGGQTGVDGPTGGGGEASVREIAASATDPAIDDVLGVHHVAIGAAEERQGRLLLFYPGTGAAPQEYTALIERGAALGYHAIGLAYINEIPVNVLCNGMGATDCHERVRREILLGVSESELVEVDADNGALNRVHRLLDHLEMIAPDEGWEMFREGDALVWDKVTVAGHSQGGGHAAFTARLYPVARAVLFSGTEPVLWTQADDFETPSERFFGFVHRLEPIYNPIVRSWDQIGIPGTPTNVDAQAAPPYEGSHQLFTGHMECTGDPESNGYYHNCHCADAWMPYLPDGTPMFEPVWDHLLTLEGG